MDAGIPQYGFELHRSYHTAQQNIRLRVEQLRSSWRWWRLIVSLPSDIDECSQSIGNLCTFQCVNVDGSYKCSCPAHGYVLSANGHTCRGERGLRQRLTAAVENLHRVHQRTAESHWKDHVSVLGACVVSLKKNFSFKPSLMALQLHACINACMYCMLTRLPVACRCWWMQSWKPQLFTGADVLQPPGWLQVSLIQLSSQLQEALRHVRLSLLQGLQPHSHSPLCVAVVSAFHSRKEPLLAVGVHILLQTRKQKSLSDVLCGLALNIKKKFKYLFERDNTP